MDPNAALRELQATIRDLRHQLDTDRNHVNLLKVEAACERFEALNEWLTNGGFLPAAWQR